MNNPNRYQRYDRRPFPMLPVVMTLIGGAIGVVWLFGTWAVNKVYLDSFWRIGDSSMVISAGVLVLIAIGFTSGLLKLLGATSRTTQVAIYGAMALCGVSLIWLDNTAPYQREWLVALLVVAWASVALQERLWRRAWRWWQMEREQVAALTLWRHSKGRERAILHLEQRSDSDDWDVVLEWPDSRTETVVWNPRTAGLYWRMQRASMSQASQSDAWPSDMTSPRALLPRALLIDAPVLKPEADNQAAGGYRRSAGRTRLADFGDSRLWHDSHPRVGLAWTCAGLGLINWCGVPLVAYVVAAYFSL